MFSESESQLRRIPTLTTYCQRVLSAHADALSCLGDDIRYDLIKPVLECCSAETLLRLEQSSPYLQENTSDLWERLCFKTYPLLVEQLIRNGELRPDSWREQFFFLREAEAHRLEEVSSKLRNQRMEAAERKKEREVKLTDRLPPTKRARTSATQPKTLFQKTKKEVKFRTALYTTRILPPMAQGKTYRVLPGAPSAKPPAASPSRTPKVCTDKTGATALPSASTTLSTSVPMPGEESQFVEPLPSNSSTPAVGFPVFRTILTDSRRSTHSQTPNTEERSHGILVHAKASCFLPIT
ncbi:RNA polymerase II transcription factor SIII subunit A-domain-containing protein [Pisolithus marmoratus]|nr:RNA polymerase II transcription factor SIII subunit A-domain-containing protein [Pisolithus marmoratus]